MSKPIAVIAGDIHYSLQNLELADKATRMAIAKANELGVVFIANGDTHDTKANLRGECVNAMIGAFKTAKIKPYVNIGNHCRINEKSQEHSLNFLRPYTHIIETPTYVSELGLYIIPYNHDPDSLRAYLATLPKNSTLVMHQGVNNALAGEYIIDKSAIPMEALADFRTILSHYHARQDIVCGRPRQGAVGLASFVGAPYTMSYGEATDLPKGFQILMDDGTLEFVPTNLRRHYIVNWDLTNDDYTMRFSDKLEPILTRDICWVKVHGTKERLSKVEKRWVRNRLFGSNPEGDFRLDLIPNDTETKATQVTQQMSSTEALDTLIQSMDNVSDEQKVRLKELWRQNASN